MSGFKTKAVVLSATDEESLLAEISGALSRAQMDMKTFRACVPIEMKNDKAFCFELCDETTRSWITALRVKVQARLNIDHPHIMFLWVPRILKSTHATVDLKIQYIATGDVKVLGKLPLNEAFLLSFGWERSIRMKDAYAKKGLMVFAQPSAPATPPGAPLGRWIPMWDVCPTQKMRYTEDVKSSMTKAQEMRVKTILNERTTRSLLRSVMANEYTCREQVPKFLGPSEVQLSDDLPEFHDFTLEMISERKPENIPLKGAVKAIEIPNNLGVVQSGNGVSGDRAVSASKRQEHNTL
ncbi:cell to cell movement protein [Apple ilarvirus 2]|uniref:Movement protein n=1 Tax=Apple ilarvirus 2 TaxID=2990546 RepID=A0AAX3E5I3_9BROM|nr:cell to cell movement protein [Apple ilarvirus 2]